MKNILLGDIARSNESYIQLKDKEYINYLDTSSITENIISNVQMLFLGTDIIPSRAKRSVKKNTIIYSSVRPNLKHFGIIEEPLRNMVVSTGFITIDVKDTKKYLPKYIYYNLSQQKNTDYLQSIAQTNVSAYPSINDTDLMGLELKISVDITEQQKIADVLSALDDKIELNNKINAELEATAKDLYNYWFVQFDFPDGNGRPYKSSGGKMVYNPILKREIPDGWTVENFNNYVNIVSGFSFNSSSYESDGCWKIVTIKNVKDNDLDLSNVETITNIPKKMPDYAKLEVGDILISLTGNVGRMCFVDSENLLLNQRVGKIIAKDRFSVFSYLFLSSAENRQRLEQISNGSSQKNLSPIQAVDFLFAVPDERVLEKFDEYSEYIYKTIISNRKQSRLLQKIRDFLLPMLMNGQISVD